MENRADPLLSTALDYMTRLLDAEGIDFVVHVRGKDGASEEIVVPLTRARADAA